MAILQAKLPRPEAFTSFPGPTNGSFQNVNFSIPAIYREDQYMGNVDYVISSKHYSENRPAISHRA